MIESLQIELQVDSDARSYVGRPYLSHEDFIKYCIANGVNTNSDALEAYEKKHLLNPCLRLLYPAELLKSRFRADLAGADYCDCREEWDPLINLENALAVSQMSVSEEFKNAVAKGHPFEQALAAGMPFIVDPSKEKFRKWSRYIVVNGSYMGRPSKKNRADHYYSTWKLFFLDELNHTNTVSYNRATGQRSQWRLRQDELHTCSLNEFMPYFRKVATFSYCHNLRKINYRENLHQAKTEWHDVVDESQCLAKTLFKEGHKKWIRFLRKLIELHVDYRGCLRLVIVEETKRYIARTVRLISFATGYDFKRICDDVCGPLINRFDGVGHEDGVHIYPRMLEEILASEEWDLRRNVKRQFKRALEDFNKLLVEKEKIPGSLCEELFNELIKEPEGPALVAIRKIDRALNTEQLYHNAELWSGIAELSKSLEVHGKGWGMGGRDLEGVLKNLFSQYSDDYSIFKKNPQKRNWTDAVDSDDFLNKLRQLMTAEHIPGNKRLGRHLLVAHLTRNYASHQKGLSGKCLRENRGQIYNALMGTLFVFYAAYTKQ